ncbi:MAG: hypothetical protein JSV95_08185 [Gemmatimonadota bacterium]|nr:MAG: hypothetical protein JSV95_08185 [Gemmatimonadota bacterium]
MRRRRQRRGAKPERLAEQPRTGAVLGALLGLLALSWAGCESAPDGDPGAAAAGGGDGEASREVGASLEGGGRPAGPDTTLRRLAETLLPEVEAMSGIRSVRPLALASSSRETLEGFLARALDEQLPPERAEAVGAVYARLGLLPDTLQLAPLFRSLLLEQVVGYYDPARDTLYVVEGVSELQLEPVLVHEMVHALQDQRTDLDSLTRSLADANDRATAAQAALEGHATFVMMEWLLSRQTGASVDLTAMPDLGGLLGGLDPSLLAGTPVLRDAPRVIRESLIFPYLGGLVFLQRIWSEDALRPLPFGGAMPRSTEQVLHPERFVPDPDEPVDVVFAAEPPAPWGQVHSDGLGELEIRVFLEEHLGDETVAGTAAEGWDGDRYRLLRDGDGEVLIWVTVWDTARDAAQFAAAARQAFEARYANGGGGRTVRVERGEVEGRQVVTVLDVPRGVELGSVKPGASGGGGLAEALRFEIRGG